uniref:Poly [ADP-ribose] polymerase n=1 Tax=Lepisosteus oculatus TaxID=7918 RepID=W5M6V2_LEPOC
MEDSYSYPLIVEGDWGADLSKVIKNKLQIYFQSKKKSGGGDCQVEYEDLQRPRATVWFKSQDIRDRALERGSHELVIEGQKVTLTVRLKEETEEATPPVEGPATVRTFFQEKESGKLQEPDYISGLDNANQDAGGEQSLQTCSVVLENVQEKLTREVLGMMVENICNLSEENRDFTLEMMCDIKKAVISFTNRNDVGHFLKECMKNKRFCQNNLRAQPLEPSRSVRVENLPRHVTEDLLELYFEKEKNGGGAVDCVAVLPEEQSAIVTFQDPTVAENVIRNRHQISKVPVSVYLYYESLGTALYGKDRPVWKLPDPFTESIDPALWKFLHTGQKQVTVISSQMEKHFCEVDLRSPTVRISPLSALLKQKGLTAKHIDAWKENASAAFRNTMSKYSSFEYPVNPSVWSESEKEIRRAVTQAAILEPDMTKESVAVAGLSEDANRLKEMLVEIVERNSKRLEREKNSITEQVDVEPGMYYILQQDRLQETTAAEYPELKLTYKPDVRKLILSGLVSEVFSVKSKILEAVMHMKHKQVEIDPSVTSFLSEVDNKELSYSIFTSRGISAVYKMEDGCVEIIGNSDKALAEAAKQLQAVLGFQHIHVEDRDVLRKPEWLKLVNDLKTTFNSPQKTVLIRRVESEGKDQIIVSGFCNSVKQVHEKLADFINKFSHVKEVVPVKSSAVIKFIMENKAEFWKNCASSRQVATDFDQRRPRILLSGARLYVQEVKTLFEHLAAALHTDQLMIVKPGAKKYFQEIERKMFVSIALREHNCVVLLQDDRFLEEEEVDQSVCQVQMSDGVAITVCKADICQYPADAVVNASNENLQHIGGLALALLKAAGHQLQDLCDQHIRRNGPLKPGDAVITDAGRLPCKHVIHAVGPRFGDTDSRRAVCLLKRAVKESLRLAETHNCSSIAIPAISSGIFGFPLDLCAETIARSVREHCQDFYGENTLRKIHLVNNDDKTVRAMTAAVQKEFADVAPQLRSLPAKPAEEHRRFRGGERSVEVESRGALETVQTKEGLAITLRKGNIQEASTDVIVNTISEDLDLNKGAVSKAIFQAAGLELQTLVKTETAGARFDHGDVVITGGCMLRCNKVFHVICPSWDQGRGKAEEVLKHLIKECLKEADMQKQKSMSFPAIGTGNLGFPRSLVASVMLDQVLKFSSKWSPKHLQQVVFIVHPSDEQTVRDFTAEFRGQPKGHRPQLRPSAEAQQETAFFSRISSPSLGVYRMTMGGLTLEVLTGDITRETTDVIVNSSNSTFSLKSGVSKAILDAAGRAVELECLQLVFSSPASQPNDGLIMTQPGNLQCQHIIHIVGQNDPNNIRGVVRTVLRACEERKFQSVAFPALGTGQGGASPAVVADAMINAVVDFVSKKNGVYLKHVRILIFQATMLTDFHKSMQTKEGTALPEQKSLLSRLKCKTALFLGDNSAEAKPQEEFVIVGEEIEPAIFQFCAETSHNLAKAKDWIKDLIVKEQTERTISDKWIAFFSDREHQKIHSLQKRLQISAKLESRGSDSSIQLAGLTRDVLDAITEIQAMIRKIETEEVQKRDAVLVGSVVEWQYEDNKSFVPFDTLTNLTLEQAFGRKTRQVRIKIKNYDYEVDPHQLVAEGRGNKTIKLKRVLLTDDSLGNLPSHWTDMKGLHKMQVQLTVGSREYQEVENEFRKTCPNSQIIKIERIQNSNLWKSYQIKKKFLEEKNCHSNNERLLFHGTSPSNLGHINAHGFNRSYAGRNAAVIGNGTYFAVDASYSASNTYSVPDSLGQKFMYLTRVLTGDYTRGSQGLIVPPAKNSTDSTDLYDSVVDNTSNPRVFVIFHDVQAYPEYLITFS